MSGHQFLGHWKLQAGGSENWDEFMRAAGIGFFLRLVGNRITTYEEWTRDGNQWSVHLTSAFMNKRLTFKLNEEFDEETLDGRKVKSLVTLEGDKLIHRQTAKPGEFSATAIRERLQDGRILVTFVSEDKTVTAKQYFTAYKP